jgi:hypothetical protein
MTRKSPRMKKHLPTKAQQKQVDRMIEKVYKYGSYWVPIDLAVDWYGRMIGHGEEIVRSLWFDYHNDICGGTEDPPVLVIKRLTDRKNGTEEGFLLFRPDLFCQED